MRQNSSQAGRLVEGRYVILALFGLGLAASLGSCGYYYWLQRRPLDLWGISAATLMMRANEVQALRLEPAPEKSIGKTLTINSSHFQCMEEANLVESRGFIHIRQLLVNREAFEWTNPAKDCQPDWPYAMRFSEGAHSATLAFDERCSRMVLIETGATARLKPAVAEEFGKFFREQFSAKE